MPPRHHPPPGQQLWMESSERGAGGELPCTDKHVGFALASLQYVYNSNYFVLKERMAQGSYLNSVVRGAGEGRGRGEGCLSDIGTKKGPKVYHSPSLSMFCGDETGGLVVDIGAYNSRFGFSGEDTPKSVFNSVRGKLKVLVPHAHNRVVPWGEPPPTLHAPTHPNAHT